jgi:hypothetical protein
MQVLPAAAAGRLDGRALRALCRIETHFANPSGFANVGAALVTA